MKKFFHIFAFFLCISAVGTLSSCSPKVGCEINENYSPSVNKKGQLSKKGGKSQLFGKKQRKKMGL